MLLLIPLLGWLSVCVSFHSFPHISSNSKKTFIHKMSDVIDVVNVETIEKSAKDALKSGCSDYSRAKVNEYVLEVKLEVLFFISNIVKIIGFF